MEKIIEIDLINENDFFEKYNRKNISKNLIDYIIESTPSFNKNDIIKIVINNKLNNVKCKDLIKEALKEEYKKCISRYHRTNKVQLIYLLIGILAIFISTLIEKTVFKEIVLIGGWVLIWSMIELEISSDSDNRRKRRILKKLLNSEVIEK